LSRVQVKSPGPLEVSESQHATKTWKLWKQMWGNYAIVTNLDSQREEYRKAVFLCTIGQSALEIYNSFQYADGEDPDNLDTIIAKYDEHFTGEINETYERFQFNKRVQQAGETFESYLTEVRNMAKTCNFCKCMVDSLIRDQLVLGIRDDSARTRLLQERKLDLKRCIDICRSTESAINQLGAITEQQTSVYKVEKAKERFRPRENRQKSQRDYRREPREAKCKFCTTVHPFKKELCPAWGKRCNVCGEKNHWRGSVVCERKEKAHAVDHDNDEQDSDFEPIYTLNHYVNGVDADSSNSIV
ncbi:MAG: hypothetical protein DSY43_07205, partial [Gammaproteobacteria bacterium]